MYTHDIVGNNNGTFMIVFNAYNYSTYKGALFNNDGSIKKVGGANCFDISSVNKSGSAENYVTSLLNGNFLVSYKVKPTLNDTNSRDFRVATFLPDGTRVSETIIEVIGNTGIGKPIGLKADSYITTRFNVSLNYLKASRYDLNGNAIELNKQITDLRVGGSFHFATAGYDAGVASFLMKSDYGVEVRLYGFPQPLSAPIGLEATAGNEQATLSWNSVTGATNYKVYQRTAAGTYGASPVVTVTETNTIITGLTNGTTYYFVVKASNAGGDSINSNEASAMPTAPNIPTAVTLTADKALGRADKKPEYANAKVPFTIDSQSFSKSLTGYSFDVIYDPAKVGNVTVDSFSGLAKPTIVTTTSVDGSTKKKVTVNWSGTFTGDLTTLYNTNKGILFKLNFVVNSAFTSGQTTPVKVGVGSFTFTSGGATTNITGTGGNIMFGIYGDVNDDGAITSSDTNLINKYVAGKTNAITGETRLSAADVNGDVSITAADAKEISNYISGKASTLKTLFGY